MKPVFVIVGLGNPGENDTHTRHNAGFLTVDSLSKVFGEGEWREKAAFHASVQEARVMGAPILLVKPLTYMNRSGEAVRAIVDFYKIDPSSQLLVLCDDVDLLLGSVRFRKKGGGGTHNGLRSIVEHIGEAFARIRIGIGPKPEGADLATWVLHAFSGEEMQKITSAFSLLPDRIRAMMKEHLI